MERQKESQKKKGQDIKNDWFWLPPLLDSYPFGFQKEQTLTFRSI